MRNAPNTSASMWAGATRAAQDKAHGLRRRYLTHDPSRPDIHGSFRVGGVSRPMCHFIGRYKLEEGSRRVPRTPSNLARRQLALRGGPRAAGRSTDPASKAAPGRSLAEYDASRVTMACKNPSWRQQRGFASAAPIAYPGGRGILDATALALSRPLAGRILSDGAGLADPAMGSPSDLEHVRPQPARLSTLARRGGTTNAAERFDPARASRLLTALTLPQQRTSTQLGCSRALYQAAIAWSRAQGDTQLLQMTSALVTRCFPGLCSRRFPAR